MDQMLLPVLSDHYTIQESVRDALTLKSLAAIDTRRRAETELLANIDAYVEQRIAVHMDQQEDKRRARAAQEPIQDSTDAMRWADTFIETITDPLNDDSDPHDAGFMVGWFANAIEAGRRAVEETRARNHEFASKYSGKPIVGNQGAVMTPPRDANYGSTEPTLEEQVAMMKQKEEPFTVRVENHPYRPKIKDNPQA